MFIDLSWGTTVTRLRSQLSEDKRQISMAGFSPLLPPAHVYQSCCCWQFPGDLFSSLETHTRQESISFFGNIWHNNTLSSVSGFQSRLIWDILGPKKTYMGSVLGDMSKKAKGPGAVSVESLKAQLEAPLAAGGRMAWQLQKIHETTNILRVFFRRGKSKLHQGSVRWKAMVSIFSRVQNVNMETVCKSGSIFFLLCPSSIMTWIAWLDSGCMFCLYIFSQSFCGLNWSLAERQPCQGTEVLAKLPDGGGSLFSKICNQRIESAERQKTNESRLEFLYLHPSWPLPCWRGTTKKITQKNHGIFR